jgi:phosphopantothenoylcysteine decarboxylase/phosphopantothenate--cysteine ligase
MDRDMYRHPATRRNLEQLQAYGYEVMPAAHGELASGLVGQGRLPEPDAIVDRIAAHLAALPDGDSPSPDADGEASEIGSPERPLAGRRVLVTAGPTQEPIDPVRVLTNPSTGTMGYALAEAAARRGAQVTLVSGPTALETPPGVERVDVTTAEEMHEAVQTRREATDLFFMAAAVADFTPADPSDTKLKKDATGASDEDEAFVLRLRRTPDILRTVGTHRRDDQVLVGFALETDDGLANARRKLEAKHLDWIALNNLRDEGAGFGTGTNQVTLLHRSGATETLPRMPKRAVADAMLDRILAQGLPAPAAGEAAGTPPGDAHADESTEAATSGGPPS